MRTRFAPSPTGPLHLGHAYAAMVAKALAERGDGQFLLRLEDIDQSRCRSQWEAQIYQDLEWLDLSWDGAILRQSERQSAYETALDRLWAQGLLYPCNCRRRDIQAALSAPQEGAPVLGPDGLVYPGSCRAAPRSGPRPQGVPLRLDLARALDQLGLDGLTYEELAPGRAAAPRWDRAQLLGGIGDVVLARRDMGTSYHLAVVLDDAATDITHVTRGEDLADATFIHVLIQKLLGLSSPKYLHHRLVRDGAGKRLAKRDDARAIAKYREDGITPAALRAQIPNPLDELPA